MKLKNILLVILVVIVALAAFRVIGRLTSAKKTEAERPIPVVIQKPGIGDIEYKITLTGDIKADTEVNVRPRTAGRVEEIYVKEGDYVDKGDRLLSFVRGISLESDIYEDMVVRAPITGVIGAQLVKVGEQITGMQGSLSPVFTIYDIDTVKLYADVPEKVYSLVRRGTPAEIRLDAYPDRLFSGQVNNIRPVIDPLSRTTQIEFKMRNPGQKIKPGMFAKIDLILTKHYNIMVIPFDAVLGEEEKFVYVAENGQAVKKPVKLGLQQDENVEVLGGLAASDKVIVIGQRVVKPGAKVEETK
ncbi:MAG: efflux RND transporter periplasmic adaptor subunit [Candidatus Margulisbacteria bacterium]|nr:efflux RND transporter periplasmic adaptor subunit [Candidatus Margulisiibacteriota bacterium]